VDDQIRRDRKYKAFWGVFLFSCVALFFSKISGAEWVNFNIFAFGLYMAGNVGEHGTVAWAERGATRPGAAEVKDEQGKS